MPIKHPPLRSLICLIIPLSFLTCTTAVSPEYQFVDGLIYIDAFVGTTEGASYVKISESEIGAFYRNIFVSQANVAFINALSGEKVPLLEENYQYLPAEDFKGETGDQWYLEVYLPNGKHYLSEIETIQASVPIGELNVRYDKELEFNEDYDKYIPGHEIGITFDDPENQTNYYYWRFKTYDKAQLCEICYQGYFRGECIPFTIPSSTYAPYYTYNCETDCWQIDYGSKIEIFSDKFSNGLTTSSLPIANVLLTRKTKILVEIQQFSITPKAHDYFRTIQNLVDKNGGFNAPLPAALIGNMYNPEDADEFVLGRFTASSATIKSIMIDRTLVEEPPFGYQIIKEPETEGAPVPRPYQYTAPCEESRYRTIIEPEGWIE